MTDEVSYENIEFWAVFKKVLKEKYNLIDQQMKLWFDESQLTLLTDEEAVITTKTDFKKSILEKNYMKQIRSTFRELLGTDIDVTIRSVEAEKNREKELEKAAKESSQKQDSFYSTVGSSSVLNYAAVPAAYKDFTFENFIVGKSNEMAVAAAKAVAAQPSKNYNPLFIYGPSGLGKTHLLYAITQDLAKRFDGIKVVYVKGDDFTNQLIHAISENQNAEFRAKYRSCDVLLIDDIQFIAGKDATQEEFFHTFNELYENGKQIVFASDRPPKDIERLEERLRTRFESGLTVDIDPPDLELRAAIVSKKSEKIGMALPKDVVDYVAVNLVDNVRQLEGAVKKIYAQSLLTGTDVTIDTAIACISDKIVSAVPKNVTIEKILVCVSQRYGVTVAELKGRSRVAKVVMPRHIAVYLIKKLTGSSLPAVGKVFGRDHTTVLNSLGIIEKRLSEEPAFEAELAELSKNIKLN